MERRPLFWTFYATVALLIACDGALLTGIIWISLEISGSTVPLGVILCLSVAIPFLLETLLGSGINRISLGRLVLIRIVIFCAIAVLVPLGAAEHVSGFLLIALAVGMVDYFTLNALETENAKRVIAGEIAGEPASKMMQTAIQAGSFAGALLGGLLIGGTSKGAFIVGLGTLGGLASLLLLPASGRRRSAVQDRAGETAQGTAPASDGWTGGIVGRSALPLLLGLGFIGFHIGAFNSMVPIVYQRLNGWDAAVFGLAGGLAGLGAFLVSVLPTIRVNGLAFPVLIVVVDAILVFSPSVPLSVFAAFLLGFSINHVRISIRMRLIETARTDADAERIGSSSAFYFLCFQAASPLVLTALTSGHVLGGSHAPMMMVMSGLLLCCATLLTPGALRVSYSSGR